jgi:hypothetical protein
MAIGPEYVAGRDIDHADHDIDLGVSGPLQLLRCSFGRENRQGWRTAYRGRHLGHLVRPILPPMVTNQFSGTGHRRRITGGILPLGPAQPRVLANLGSRISLDHRRRARSHAGLTRLQFVDLLLFQRYVGDICSVGHGLGDNGRPHLPPPRTRTGMNTTS